MKPNIHPAVKFKEMIIKRFSVRLHMFVILTAVITFGLVLSNVLLLCGLTNLIIRSAAVIAVSYIFFFIAIRVWLYYVLPSLRKKESPSSSSSFDGADIGSFDISAGKGSGIEIPSGGGSFSGAGAGGSWTRSAAALAMNDASTQAAAAETVNVSSAASSAGSSGFSLGDLDIDSAGAIVILLIGIVIAAMLGGAVYLIVEAPVILSEAAFNALLSGGMIRASKQMRGEDWTGSVFKATWIPFAVIAGITVGAAAILTYMFPGETNISDIVRHTLLQ